MAANAVDERLFFASKVGGTIRMPVETNPQKLDAAIGLLKPGKYFVQLIGAVTCWVKTGKDSLPDAVNRTPNPDGTDDQDLIPEFFLDASGITSFVFHVRNSKDEGQIYAIASGDAVLLITKTGE